MLKNEPVQPPEQGLGELEPVGRPLGWPAWLLIPLVAIALFGVVVPLWRDVTGTAVYASSLGSEFEALELPEAGEERRRFVASWSAGWLAGLTRRLARDTTLQSPGPKAARRAFEESEGLDSSDLEIQAFEEGFEAGSMARRPRDFARGAGQGLMASPAISDLFARLDEAKDPGLLFASWQAFSATRSDLSRTGIQEDDLRAFDRRVSGLIGRVIALDPDHAGAREQRGEAPYRDEMKALAERPGLPEAAVREARALHERLAALAAKNGGWVSIDEMDKVDELLERHDG